MENDSNEEKDATLNRKKPFSSGQLPVMQYKEAIIHYGCSNVIRE